MAGKVWWGRMVGTEEATRRQQPTLFSSSQLGSFESMATIIMLLMLARRLDSTHLPRQHPVPRQHNATSQGEGRRSKGGGDAGETPRGVGGRDCTHFDSWLMIPELQTATKTSRLTAVLATTSHKSSRPAQLVGHGDDPGGEM